MGRIRVEIDDEHGTVAGVLDDDELALTPEMRKQLATLAGGLVRDLAAVLGCDEGFARQAAVAQLMRLVADESAYERVAGRRGLLPF